MFFGGETAAWKAVLRPCVECLAIGLRNRLSSHMSRDPFLLHHLAAETDSIVMTSSVFRFSSQHLGDNVEHLFTSKDGCKIIQITDYTQALCVL